MPKSHKDENPLLYDALNYQKMGLSILPIGGDKLPIRTYREHKGRLTWKRYQTRPATRKTIRRWFDVYPDLGRIAVVHGEVSGGLMCRDFDDAEGFMRWKEEYAEIAHLLPIVQSRRGFHAYFRGNPEIIAQELGQRKCFWKCGRSARGELRLERCFTLLPPSDRGDGEPYRWINNPLTELDDAPWIKNPANVGLINLNDAPGRIKKTRSTTHEYHTGESVERGVKREPVKIYEASPDPVAPDVPSLDSLDPELRQIILSNLPSGKGERRHYLFRLACVLKASQYGSATWDFLESVVRVWWALAYPVITDKDLGFNLREFRDAWENSEPMRPSLDWQEVLAQAKASGEDLPTAICRELQAQSGEEPFFLSGKLAGELIGVSQPTASRRLKALRERGVIQLVERGNSFRKLANTYYFLGDPRAA